MSNLFHKLSERRRYFSWGKLSNWGMNKYHFMRRDRAPGSYPDFMIIEPCNLCNLQCPLCPTGQKLPVARGTMSMDTFRRVVDQLAPYVRYASLYYLGEPLLCGHLPEMISYARKRNIRTFVSSNLNILTRQMAEELISAELDYLIVSLDGASQESYEQYRTGGDFHKVVENLRLMIRMKKAKKSPYPRLVMQPVIFRHNEGDVSKLRELAASLGVELFLRQGTLGGEGQSPPLKKDHELALQWLSRNREYHKEYNYLSSEPYLKDEPCYYLWKGVTINWDGSVFPCCWVYDSRYSFGNIMDEDLAGIWNNALYQSSRNLFARSRRAFSRFAGNGRETICYQCKIFRHNLNEQH